MSLFSSPFDRLVEVPTDERLPDVDWLASLELVETLNKHPEHSKEILKSIRKRLNSSKRHVQYLSVCLLEVCIKNCGLPFHLQVASKDSMESLYKAALQYKEIKTPNEKEEETKIKLLNLIQSLYTTFKDDGRMSAINETYGKLLKKGILFPDNPNNEAPIHTPPVNRTIQQTINPPPSSSSPSSSFSSDEKKSSVSSSPHPLSFVSDQFALKIKAEFCTALNYCQLLKETISTDSSSLTSDIVLSLAQTVGEIRTRISSLIVELLDNEQLLDLCIVMNEIVRIHLEYYQARKNGMKVSVPEFDCPPALIPHLPPDMKQSIKKSINQSGNEEEKKAPAPAIINNSKAAPVSNVLNLDIFSSPAVPVASSSSSPPAQIHSSVPVPAAASISVAPSVIPASRVSESKAQEPSQRVQPVGRSGSITQPAISLPSASSSPSSGVSPAAQPRSPNPFANPAPAPVVSQSSFLPPTISPLDPFADIIARNSAPVSQSGSNRQEGEPDPFLALAARAGSIGGENQEKKSDSSTSFDPFASQPSFDNPGSASSASIFDDFLQMNPGPGQK
jgi:hypothetical protein